MSDQISDPNATQAASSDDRRLARKRRLMFAGLVAAVAIATAGVTALLINMFTRKQEARQPFVRVVDVNKTTTDPEV
jgi:anti-sigma-K factor RskA